MANALTLASVRRLLKTSFSETKLTPYFVESSYPWSLKAGFLKFNDFFR